MAERFDLVIVGLGSAGLTAADLAATLGLSVCAIEAHRVGGDCLWTGCVPSKTLIAAARAAHAVRTAGRFGIAAGEPRVDGPAVMARVREVRDAIARTDDDPDRYRAKGVDVRVGRPATVTGPHTVRVGDELVHGRAILLCTGSRPAPPPVPGLEATPHLTSETVWELDDLPGSLLVLGGGSVAVELAQAMARLGVRVTLLERAARLLAEEEPELVDRLAATLRDEGVEVVTGVDVDRIEPGGDGVRARAGERAWTAERLFVGAGRAPNADGLGLEALGIEAGPGGVRVDARSRTSVPSIYAVGDLAGQRFTHAAAQQAALAVRDLALPGRARFGQLVPWVTFTEPELAHAGLTSAQARARHGDRVRTWRLDLAHSDRARADGVPGVLLAVTHRRRLVGAHVLAPGAGELIGELALAIQKHMKLEGLAGLVHPYPTLSTSVAQLGAQAAFETARRYKWLVRRRR